MLAEKEGTIVDLQHQQAMWSSLEVVIGEPVTIITTGKEPSIVLREETDGDDIRTTIDTLTVTYEHEYMERALELARSIASAGSAEIHIYTDSLDRALFSEEQGNLAWTIHGSEEETSNVSINSSVQ